MISTFAIFYDKSLQHCNIVVLQAFLFHVHFYLKSNDGDIRQLKSGAWAI